MISIPTAAIVTGLFLQLAGVLVTLGMLIKTVNLLEKAQEKTDDRIGEVANDLVEHRLDEGAHPALKARIETATALAERALAASSPRGGHQ